MASPDEPAILKHLAKQEEQRKIEREKKRAASKLEADPTESAEAFLAHFNLEVAEVESKLSALSSAGDAVVGDVKQLLDNLLSDILDIDSEVSKAVYFLPKYDLKQSREVIQNLRKKVEDRKESLVPKKKFCFSKRSKLITTQNTGNQNVPSTNQEEPLVPVNTGILNFRGLRCLQNKQLRVSGEELGSNEYSLIDLEDCTIFLIGKFSALHVRKLQNCTVVAGPVTGSVLIEDVSKCQFHLACHQARIHSAKDVSFSLRVNSNPIIEHSTSVQFSPLSNEDILAWNRVVEGAFLDNNSDLWSKVNDFGWLKATPSPNWSLVPPDQYPEVPQGAFVEKA